MQSAVATKGRGHTDQLVTTLPTTMEHVDVNERALYIMDGFSNMKSAVLIQNVFKVLHINEENVCDVVMR